MRPTIPASHHTAASARPESVSIIHVATYAPQSSNTQVIPRQWRKLVTQSPFPFFCCILLTSSTAELQPIEVGPGETLAAVPPPNFRSNFLDA